MVAANQTKNGLFERVEHAVGCPTVDGFERFLCREVAQAHLYVERLAQYCRTYSAATATPEPGNPFGRYWSNMSTLLSSVAARVALSHSKWKTLS